MKIPIVPWGTQTRQARSKLINEGQIPEGLLRDHIERSWQRCVGQGLDPSRLSPLDAVGRAELKAAQERNLALLSEAKPLMESLHEQISGSGSMVILTDPAGLIIHSLGDPEFISKAQRVALKPGVSWAEDARGTNAIGTAAVEQTPVLVHAGEHFFERNNFLTCSAAPIFDPKGRLAGVLDISGDQRCYHKHTLALVRLTAKMIERRLVLSQHGSELLVHLHRIPEFAGTLCEGVMAFSEAGRILGATYCAFTELGISPDTMHQHSFATLFDMPLEAALGQAMRGGLHSVPLEPRPGHPMFATVQVGPALTARRLSA
ncbi:MAG TPA: GAF domain-containing protein, partial [Burkholderiales bacterium]|nr:GAF domain-containing protein [Burkholderiales bacterium]